MRKFPEQRAGRLCALVAVAVFAVSPCYSQQARERGSRGVGELRKLSDLKSAFDRDNGKVRLVVLVSPT